MTASAFAAIPQAHAGFLQDMFTFREEQKPRIDPNNIDIPPVEVITPYYNNREATDWARHYTRKDLKATPYMDGTSSMVMRADTARLKQQMPAPGWPGQVKARVGAPQQRNGSGPPQGYEAILWRDYMNRLTRKRNRTFVGEPGSAPWKPRDTNANIGKKTQVGKPVNKWDELKNADRFARIEPRPGDYNYRQPTQQDGGYSVHRAVPGEAAMPPGGREITRSPAIEGYKQGYDDNRGSLYDGPRPNRYIVEGGDTLSGISEKDRIYGNWKMWPLIFDANRTQIQDPDLIYPKQDLGIPRDYTDSDQNSAIGRALDKRPPHTFHDGR